MNDNGIELPPKLLKMWSAGCTLTGSQPVMRTVPPLTRGADGKAHRVGQVGSMSQRRAATGPGRTCQRFGVESSCRLQHLQHHRRHRDVRRRRRQRQTGVLVGQAIGERCRGAAARTRAWLPTHVDGLVPPAGDPCREPER